MFDFISLNLLKCVDVIKQSLENLVLICSSNVVSARLKTDTYTIESDIRGVGTKTGEAVVVCC